MSRGPTTQRASARLLYGLQPLVSSCSVTSHTGKWTSGNYVFTFQLSFNFSLLVFSWHCIAPPPLEYMVVSTSDLLRHVEYIETNTMNFLSECLIVPFYGNSIKLWIFRWHFRYSVGIFIGSATPGLLPVFRAASNCLCVIAPTDQWQLQLSIFSQALIFLALAVYIWQCHEDQDWILDWTVKSWTYYFLVKRLPSRSAIFLWALVRVCLSTWLLMCACFLFRNIPNARNRLSGD